MNRNLKFGIAALVLAAVGLFGVSTVTFDKVKEQPSTTPGSSTNPSNNDWIGKKAPDFKLAAYDGKQYSLADLKGKKVVLFFNEGIMCYPACWNQIAALGTDANLNTSDVVALSIVVDTPTAWKEVITKMPALASAKVLFDVTRSVSQEYNVLSLPSSMHKGSFPGHTYFVLDRQGVVRFSLDDPRMAIRNQDILAEVNKIN